MYTLQAMSFAFIDLQTELRDKLWGREVLHQSVARRVLYLRLGNLQVSRWINPMTVN